MFSVSPLSQLDCLGALDTTSSRKQRHAHQPANLLFESIQEYLPKEALTILCNNRQLYETLCSHFPHFIGIGALEGSRKMVDHVTAKEKVNSVIAFVAQTLGFLDQVSRNT